MHSLLNCQKELNVWIWGVDNVCSFFTLVCPLVQQQLLHFTWFTLETSQGKWHCVLAFYLIKNWNFDLRVSTHCEWNKDQKEQKIFQNNGLN